MCKNGVVVVVVNSESRLHMPLSSCEEQPLGAVVSGFFIAHPTSVLHTIVVSLHGLLGRKHRTHHTRGQKATSVD